MISILRSIIIWIIILFTIIFVAPVFLVTWLFTFLFDKRLYILSHVALFWGSLYTRLNPWWHVHVEGVERINKDDVYVVVANHQSLEDIIVMYRLGKPFRWVSKAEVFKIPVFGWLMNLSGDIKLKRTSKASIKKMLIDGEKALNKGCTLFIFPEGTRSRTGNIGNFKEGAFKLAQLSKRSIIPVVIEGTKPNLLNKYGLFFGTHHVKIRVLDEIPVVFFQNMETSQLANHVKLLMENELVQIRTHAE
jgi:1-acyl-sn-glycerol-3-phosphate acyltransferase